MSYAEKRGGKLTGIWIAERVIEGKRKRLRCPTKAAADKWEAIVDATGKPPMDGTGAFVPHPIGEVAKLARRERKGWKGSHDTSLDQRLEVIVEFFTPTASLESITKAKLYSFVSFLEGRKGRDGGALSPKTVNRYLAVVSGLLDFARECAMTTNTVSMPWQDEDEGNIEFFTPDQEQCLMGELKPDEAKVLRLLILTGMRAAEFFELAPHQIVTSSNEQAWIGLTGDDTKTGKGRVIPVNEIHLAVWLKDKVTEGSLMSHNEFYVALKAACKRLGYSKDLTVHSCRHTTATRLAQLVKPALVQDFMGHASYKTTQKYIHLRDEDRAAAGAALAAF